MIAAPEAPVVAVTSDAGVTVRPFRSGDAAFWEAYVQRAPSATFFHRLGWRTLLEETFAHRTHYRVAERDGRLVGVLPLAETRSRWFGHTLVSLPFCVEVGPAADDAEAARALVVDAEALAESLGVDHLELRHGAGLPESWPHSDLYVAFRRRLEPDPEANLVAIPRKQRAMVRKGIKHGLASEVDAGPDRFFELYADNVHRHGTPPFSRRYFERLREVFAGDCEFLTVVDKGGQAVSGVLSFYFRDQVLPYYAGDTVEARELAANDFKYWELMRRACGRGIGVFDYGRSKRGSGSFDFKKNWGFVPTPLDYRYRLFNGAGVPQRNPANPRYRMVIDLWRHLPRPLVNALGPALVRHLG